MSPSWTTYSLPSVASLPAALTALSLPRVTQAKSLYLMTSALKKPFSKSVWKTPYGLRALSPLWMIQVLHSSDPAVKKVWSPSGWYTSSMLQTYIAGLFVSRNRSFALFGRLFFGVAVLKV